MSSAGMIDKVAEAVRAANVGEWTSDDQSRRIARAAIEAMREPPEELLDIGVHATGIPWGFGIADAELLWRAVIDAALSTTHNPEEM